MSGDQRTDQPDPLDDDFVIEDLAGKNDDLESLFTSPAKPAASKPAGSPPDEDDVLFTDHTQGLSPSEKFQGKEAFAEDSKSQWNGENLELDQAAAGGEDGITGEVGALLQSEEEFGPDSEKELELVGGGNTENNDEFEQSSAFVLEDGDTAWRQEEPAAAAEAPAAGEVEEPALVEDDTPVEPGWEPLAESNVDQLSEVGEVARTDGEETAEPALVGDTEELSDVDGHDIYAADAPPVLVGTRTGGRRVLRLFASVAASLLVLASAALVVVRPEWFGLAFEPARVQQVHIDRPQVQLAVATPPAVPVATPEPVAVGPKPPVDPQPPVEPKPPVEPPVDVTPPVEPPVDVTPPVGQPVEQPQVIEAPPTSAWPAKERPQEGPPVIVSRDQQKAKELVRGGDDLMIGEPDPQAQQQAVARAVDGVLPGSRAFAQLHNGNYFIGSVKSASAETVTLRFEHGEITIPAAEIARLTELGSADYEQLQRATTGSVRLTNNNRLVGGILSAIADDHIILEFRSNRVMLPKSAIGQVVRGEDEGGVRLGVTPQENDWLKTLAERQLGNGAAPVEPQPSTATPGTPAPRAMPPAPSRGR